jgi:hypothetical protein
VADVLASKGAISPTYYQSLKKADLDQRKTLMDMTGTQFDNAVKATAANKQLYESVMAMPDDQVAQNWAGIAQQYNQIPGNEKRPLNPQQPLNKDQIGQQAPMLALHQAYIDDDLVRRQKAAATKGAELDTQIKQNELTAGGNQSMADARFRNILMNQKLGKAVTPEDAAFLSAYKSQKELIPAYNFNLQANGMGGNQPLNQNQQATAQAILEGRMTPPSSFALKTPYWQNVMGAVFQQDPQFSEQRAELRKDFTVGKHSTEINAINTAMGHIGVLNDAIDALNNGDVKKLNQLANAVGVQFGKDNVTTFNTIVHRVGPEIAKAYVGSGGSAGERGTDEKDFDPSLGPQSLKSNVAITAKLFRSKISAFENQWDQNKSDSMPSFEDRFIMPEARQTIDRLAPKGSASTGGGQTQGAPLTITLPSGKKITVE